jgi:hypothetical protein
MAKKDNASTRQGERITSESKRAAPGVPSGAEKPKQSKAHSGNPTAGVKTGSANAKRVPESNIRQGKPVAAPSRSERRSLLGSHDTSVHGATQGIDATSKASRTPLAQHGLSTKGAGVSQQSPSGLRSAPHHTGQVTDGTEAHHLGLSASESNEQQHARPGGRTTKGPQTARPSAGKEVIGKRTSDKPNVGDAFQSSRGTANPPASGRGKDRY